MSNHSQRTYITGFILSILLTLLAFVLVHKHLFSTEALYVVIVFLALVQFFVQLRCFLQLNTSSEGRWDLISFVFTLVVIFIVVGGSLWIMYNLNYNMMQ